MDPSDVGAFRTKQNWIGGDGFGPRNALFIPPDPERVHALVSDLVRYTTRTDIAPVVQASVAHARFEVIHPFVDGSGRVGRMLFQHVLAGRTGIPAPVAVSVAWSRDVDSYVAGLRAFQNGDHDRWIEFAATSIVDAVSWMKIASLDVSHLIESLSRRARARGNSVAARVIREVPTDPLVDSDTVARRYDVSRQAAHEALTRLSDDGVLDERSFSRRTKAGRPRRMYSNTELIDLLSTIVTR